MAKGTGEDKPAGTAERKKEPVLVSTVPLSAFRGPVPSVGTLPKSADGEGGFGTFQFGVILLFLFLAGAFAALPFPPLVRWLFVAAAFTAMLLIVGWLDHRKIVGIFIGERNLVSLARFQMVVWSIILLSAFLTMFVIRLQERVADPFNIAMEPDILWLAGIAVGSVGASAAALNHKEGKAPNRVDVLRGAERMYNTFRDGYRKSFNDELRKKPQAFLEEIDAMRVDRIRRIEESLNAPAIPAGPGVTSAEDIVDVRGREEEQYWELKKWDPAAALRGKADDQEQLLRFWALETIQRNLRGPLFANTKAKFAGLRDMIEGDEITTAAQKDLSKIQMLLFTLVAFGGYVAMMWDMFASTRLGSCTADTASCFAAFPEFSQGLVAILGISHAGYLAFRVSTKTRTVA